MSAETNKNYELIEVYSTSCIDMNNTHIQSKRCDNLLLFLQKQALPKISKYKIYRH